MSLLIDHVTKRFGSVVALDDLTFEVAPGSVFGFLGANGAGKTTTMRIALGVVRADGGAIRWHGEQTRDLPRATFGYLPEERGLYHRMTVIDQLVYFGRLYGLPRDRAVREVRSWLARFHAADLAERPAEQLSKGNQQKVQFIAAILHDPAVLLMDEPFTGLDPVNVSLLREAFLELRDRGKTLIFSTHQMETVETLCEGVAIIDRGRLVVTGSLRDVKRSTGGRAVRLGLDVAASTAWLAELPGVRVVRPGSDEVELALDEGVEPDEILAAAVGRGLRIRRFEVLEPSLEQVFIERVGRPAAEPATLEPVAGCPAARDAGRAAPRRHRRADAVSRRDPVLPNTGIVAAREFRERVRSRLFLGSTLVLAFVAAAVALAPLAMRVLDRGQVVSIVVVSSDADLRSRTMASLDGVLNLPPPGADPTGFKPRYRIIALDDAEAAIAQVEGGRIAGALVAERTSEGQLAFAFHTQGAGATAETQLVGFGTLAAAILDWQQDLPGDATNVFRPPAFEVVPTNVPTDGGRPVAPAEIASRSFLGIAFVVLIFITLIIYGMWVATGVAAEKSSRVMELMVSAASPVQLLTGKVLGLGAAGLAQYAVILAPAVVILLLQDRLALWALGPSSLAAEPLAGLSFPLLTAFLVFFLLGFALYALIYAAAGSLVSRPEDLQIAALPLSLISMAGYLVAIAALGGASGPVIRFASLVPFWSPFVMLARLLVGQVPPWELGLSIGLLVAGIVAALWLAIRVYSAGVLLYGQRPGLKAFVAAARTPR